MSALKFLKEFFDATVQKNDEAGKTAFDNYTNTKTAALLKEAEEAKSPIKLKGDDVFVKAVKVGCLKHDLDKGEQLEYTSNDGKKKKFDNLNDLYAHLGKEHKINEAKDEQLFGLYCGKKGSGKLGLEFSGTKKECDEEKAEWKDSSDHEGCVHKIVKIGEDKAQTVAESVKDYETEIQSLEPRFKKLTSVKAHDDAPGEGLDADGDHDGPTDAAQADAKRQAPLKDLIKKIKSGNK